jgi:hypothetical protein
MTEIVMRQMMAATRPPKRRGKRMMPKVVRGKEKKQGLGVWMQGAGDPKRRLEEKLWREV